MSPGTKIGIVTVTYNSGQVLEDFLNSLDVQSHKDFVLYAIDNLSTDDSVQLLRQHPGFDIRIIANPSNDGIAVGNNQGIREALADQCDWVLLLNNDTVLPPTTLANLIESADRNSAKILSPLIEASEPAGTIWYAGGNIRSAARGYQATHELIGHPLLDAPRKYSSTSYASTCCLLIAPEVFASVGYMDPVYFVYYDDLDFAIRANRAGFTYYLDPTITMLHKASSLTGGTESPFSIHWMSRNWVILVRRHASPLARPLGLAFIGLWAFARFIIGREPRNLLIPRLRAFREGLAVSLESPAPSA